MSKYLRDGKGIPKCPKGMTPEARRRWKAFVEDYDFEDLHLSFLECAMEALMRMRDAQKEIEEEGVTYKKPTGDIARHPATLIEKESRLAYLSALGKLGLNMEPPKIPGRPTAGDSGNQGSFGFE